MRREGGRARDAVAALQKFPLNLEQVAFWHYWGEDAKTTHAGRVRAPVSLLCLLPGNSLRRAASGNRAWRKSSAWGEVEGGSQDRRIPYFMAAFEGNLTVGDPFFLCRLQPKPFLRRKKIYPYRGFNDTKTHIASCPGDFFLNFYKKQVLQKWWHHHLISFQCGKLLIGRSRWPWDFETLVFTLSYNLFCIFNTFNSDWDEKL